MTDPLKAIQDAIGHMGGAIPLRTLEQARAELVEKPNDGGTCPPHVWGAPFRIVGVTGYIRCCLKCDAEFPAGAR